MQIDIAIGTIARAEAAADAPILDDDFERIAAANRTNRAAHHAEGISALAATRGYKIAVKAQAVPHKPSDAIVRIGAGVHAGVAACAILQIENEQALRFHQALGKKLIDGNAVNHLQALLIGGAALGGVGFKAGPHAGEARNHVAKIVAGDADQFEDRKS